jgi:hypothetical protein
MRGAGVPIESSGRLSGSVAVSSQAQPLLTAVDALMRAFYDAARSGPIAGNGSVGQRVREDIVIA